MTPYKLWPNGSKSLSDMSSERYHRPHQRRATATHWRSLLRLPAVNGEERHQEDERKKKLSVEQFMAYELFTPLRLRVVKRWMSTSADLH